MRIKTLVAAALLALSANTMAATFGDYQSVRIPDEVCHRFHSKAATPWTGGRSDSDAG
jgi:hypothetical protein